MKNPFVIIFLTGILSACIIQPDNRKKDFSKYSSQEIGWSVEYPKSWKVLTNNDIGQEAGSTSTTDKSKSKDTLQMRHKNLFWIEKDKFNTFSSTVQSFDSLIDGSYEKTQEALFQAMLSTYHNQGLYFQYKIGNDMIDGLVFKTYFIKFFSNDRKNVILYQVIFDRLIKGKNALTLSINFNNDKDRQTLINMVKSSKLTLRN